MKLILISFYIIQCFFNVSESTTYQICQGRHIRSKRGLWDVISNFFHPTSAPINSPICRSDWMGQLPPTLTNLFLGKLVIPGSHNAFCTEHDFSEESELGIDLETNILSSMDIPRSALTLNKDILMKWSVTQSLTTQQQLEVGLRFFDLRIAKHKTTDELHIVHGLMGKKLEVHLREMEQFLENHRNEVVFLYFQKYYNMDTTDGLNMSRTLQHIFGNRICKPTDFGYRYTHIETYKPEPQLFLDSLTLENIWEKGCQVFLFSYMDIAINEHNRFFGLPGFFWEEFLDYDGSWGNTNSVPRMLQHAETRLKTKQNVWQDGMIYAVQAVLTPTGLDVIFRNGLKKMAVIGNERFGDWMSNKTGLNVVVADFVEMDDFVGKIIERNYDVFSPL